MYIGTAKLVLLAKHNYNDGVKEDEMSMTYNPSLGGGADQ
jgi:hypothetical protein